jgi:FtsP/CotA-like multicopper oxidase with cupredoxin domain
VSKDRVRLLLACVATLAIVLPLGYLWQQSRMPSTYSVMDMGYLDYGGGSRTGAALPGGQSMAGMHTDDAAHGTRSVKDLTVGTDRAADKVVDLEARKGTVRLASGRTVDGYTLNGSSPGPLIEVTQGDLLEVHLRNANVPDGITLHWHGLDVPNAEDGVAGVTQDAVQRGQEHTYRFVAAQAGTYWYHSHQVSHEQVIGGLLGPLVVRPAKPLPQPVDVVALEHTYDAVATVNGASQSSVVARPGQQVRVRVVNTDNGPTRAWANVPYRVLAVDGHEVNEPTEVTGKGIVVTAGGRIDLGVVAPDDGSGVRIQIGSSTAVVVGPEGVDVKEPATPPTKDDVDLLSYGSPAPVGFDPGQADRSFRYAIGRRPGFVKGVPGLFWTVNGHLFPNIPMYVVHEGDVVKVRISNSSGDVHPMHLHGHHAVVLSRDGVTATGSPWWFDSLNVEDGETYDVAFVADNPGIWMDHCHNLKHANQGLLAHLMYDDVTEPYRVGGDSGNEPE